MYEDIFPSTGNHRNTSGTGSGESDIHASDTAARRIFQALEFAEFVITPGLSTLELAEMLEVFLISRGVDPGLVINISPEDTVWHGIPGKRKISAGELLTIDIACAVRGWWADAARTFAIGSVDARRKNLMTAAWEATRAIVSKMSDGSTGTEAFRAVEDICLKRKVSLIPEAAGHGIGRRIHEPPSLTYDGRTYEPLVSGRLYTAEPVITAGGGQILISSDGSAVTSDGEPSAHYEVTVLLLRHGVHILGAPGWMEQPPC